MKIFTIGKKDGLLRLIFDCRQSSAYHRVPPTTSLSTPSAFSNVDMSEETLAAVRGDGDPDAEPHAGAIDLIDSFYQFKWEGLAEFFCIDQVFKAGDFGISHVFDPELGHEVPID